MESAGYTDFHGKGLISNRLRLEAFHDMLPEVYYQLTDGVQVRREKFGLLFYDYRGPKLYFVPSQDLIGDSFFGGEQALGQLIETICGKNRDWPRQWVQNQVNQILTMLKGKGLIREQPVC